MSALAPLSRTTAVVGRPDRPFTVNEACNYLQVSRPKLYALARSGHLRMLRIGERGTRVPADDVYALAGVEVES